MSQDAAQRHNTQKHVAVVTGGARNIGQAIALRLQQDGYQVIVVDIVEPEAKSLQADARQVDLADADATRLVMTDIGTRYSVTRLVNNVGIVAPALLEEVQLEDFDKLMHLNAPLGLSPPALSGRTTRPIPNALAASSIISRSSAWVSLKTWPKPSVSSATNAAALSLVRPFSCAAV